MPQAIRVVDRLADQADVQISSPSAGQVLAYDGTRWVNQAGGGGGWVDTGGVVRLVTQSDRVEIGEPTVDPPFNPTLAVTATTATTDGQFEVLTIRHHTTGTPVAGFGAGLRWRLENTVQGNVPAGAILVYWLDPVQNQQRSRLSILAAGATSEVEGVRIEGTTTPGEVLLGFFGVNAAPRPGATADIKDALASLGLLTNGGASPLNLDSGQLDSGLHVITVTDAATLTTSEVLTLKHNSTGTPGAALFGSTVTFQLESTTTNDRNAARIETIWADAADATRKGRMTLYAADSGGFREGIRIEGDGSAVRLGFFGGVAFPKQSGTTDMKDALQVYGLLNAGASPLNLDQGRLTCGDLWTDLNTAITASDAEVMTIQVNSTGTPTNGFGARLRFYLESSTIISQNAGDIVCTWADATHASRKGRVALWAWDASARREGVRVEADGSAARLGFYGATAVAKPNVTGSRGGNAALASLLTALANLGLITDSSTS